MGDVFSYVATLIKSRHMKLRSLVKINIKVQIPSLWTVT